MIAYGTPTTDADDDGFTYPPGSLRRFSEYDWYEAGFAHAPGWVNVFTGPEGERVEPCPGFITEVAATQRYCWREDDGRDLEARVPLPVPRSRIVAAWWDAECNDMIPAVYRKGYVRTEYRL